MAEGRGSPIPPELSLYIQTTNYPSNPGKKLYINKGYQRKRDKITSQLLSLSAKIK